MKASAQTTPGEGERPAHSTRRHAAVVGVLYILATVTALLALPLYAPLLTGPEYLVDGVAASSRVLLGAVMELILVGSAVGTAVGLFPPAPPLRHSRRRRTGSV